MPASAAWTMSLRKERARDRECILGNDVLGSSLEVVRVDAPIKLPEAAPVGAGAKRVLIALRASYIEGHPITIMGI